MLCSFSPMVKKLFRYIAFFVLMQYRNVTDRQIDGHLFSGYTNACIACYATALVKTAVGL